MLGYSILNGMSLSNPFSHDSVRVRGDRWLHVNSVFQTQQEWYTFELIEIMAVCPGSAQTQARQSPCTERGTTSSHPNQKVISNWHPLTKENFVFSKGVSLGLITTLKGKPNAQQEMINTKWTPYYFWRYFLSLWAFVVLLVFCLYIKLSDFIFMGFVFLCVFLMHKHVVFPKLFWVFTYSQPIKSKSQDRFIQLKFQYFYNSV